MVVVVCACVSLVAARMWDALGAVVAALFGIGGEQLGVARRAAVAAAQQLAALEQHGDHQLGGHGGEEVVVLDLVGIGIALVVVLARYFHGGTMEDVGRPTFLRQGAGRRAPFLDLPFPEEHLRWVRRTWLPVRNLIREGKTHQIPSMIQTGKRFGMQLLDDAVMGLLNKGWIDPDEAYMKSNDKARFRPLLKNPPTDFTDA